MNFNKVFYVSVALVFANLTVTAQNNVLMPIGNVDQLPTRVSKLSEEDLKRWSHLDIINDTIPGMSVDRAYAEIIKDKIGKKVIVAVIDSGVEIGHEDLKPQIYINVNEVVNGKDDDNNGKIDDINGWNFLGNVTYENFEFTRIVKLGDKKSSQYKRANKQLNDKLNELEPLQKQLVFFEKSHAILTAYFKSDEYDINDLSNIPDWERPFILEARTKIYSLFILGYDSSYIVNLKEHVNSNQNAFLNVNFNGRSVLNDNPFDMNNIHYGNHDVFVDAKFSEHGTHVSGIIGQTRNNNLGGDGIASNIVSLLCLRAVPKGDEYDKDIALAIRYAVDNGAKVINGSFGKYFSQHNEWVEDAIKYANSNDVLIVVAAGNEGLDLNPKSGKYVEHYPNDREINSKKEFVDNFIVVGALNPTLGSNMVANFSNFGSLDVDIFAPGVDIYATIPNNKYKFLSGTSMASPNVAGVAALIRSYFPNLTASEVKKIILESGISFNQKVNLSENKKTKRLFNEISTSGKIINAYNAFIMAEEVSNKK